MLWTLALDVHISCTLQQLLFPLTQRIHNILMLAGNLLSSNEATDA